MDHLQLVPVATGLSDFEAKLLAAQLGAEGILWQTRGIVDSIYPFGGIDVLVPAAQADDARQVVVSLGERVPADVGPPEVPCGVDPSDDRGRPPGLRVSWWIGAVAAGAAVTFVVVRAFAVV